MFKKHPLLVVYILMIITIFVLPFFSTDDYSIIRHTTSELGAQKTHNAIIMNLIFVLLGISSIIESFLYLSDYPYFKYILILFGLGLVFTALFNHAPIDGSEFDIREDKLHSLFANIVGFTFTFFAFSSIFIEKQIAYKILNFFIGVFSVVMSIFIFKLDIYAGVWQRMLFIVSFIWINLFILRVQRA